MATHATGESGDPIIVEEYCLLGDTDKNPIVIEDKKDKFDFMNDWNDEQIREYLMKSSTEQTETKEATSS